MNSIPVLILYEPEADSCLSSGGLETKPTKIQASGGRKPPDSRSIDDRGLCLFLTSRTRRRRTNNATGNWRAWGVNHMILILIISHE